VDLNKLRLGDKIALGCGIVLLITLLFLPWHRACIDFGAFGGNECFNRGALESPNGFWGILALLLTVAIVAVILVERLTETELPALPIAIHQAEFYACIAVLVILLLKLVLETEGIGFGAWIAILLAGGMTYGGFLIFQSGGSDAASPGTGSQPPQPF
jgi:hypothetical protein